MNIKAKNNLEYKLKKAIFENKFLKPESKEYKKNTLTIEIYSKILKYKSN